MMTRTTSLVSLSPTKLKDYLVCPKLYEIKHVKRAVRFETSPALAFGRSLHSALEHLHSRDSGRDVTPLVGIDVEALLARHWQNPYADRRESETYFASACDALKHYLKAYMEAPDETLGCEVFMARVFDTSGLRVRLSCKADRVSIRGDGTLAITDYKTNSSGKVPTIESLQSDLPTFLYYLLARVTYPEYEFCTITYLNVLSMARVEVAYSEDEITTNKRHLREVFRQVSDENFAAQACEACAWCDAQVICPLYGAEVAFESVI